MMPSLLTSAPLSWLQRLKQGLFGRAEDRELKEALAEVMADSQTVDDDQKTALHQRLLLSNVLKLKDMRTFDVMVPRADIVGIDLDTPVEGLLSLLAQKQYSRLPVYRETLDDVLGTVHIKDILARLATGQPLVLSELIRDVPIVSPAMPVLDLMLMMKQQKKHLVLVVDEYGGIDGLVTINDIIETIVGEMDDEYDINPSGSIIEKPDGSYLADGRVDIEQFEERLGIELSDDEKEEVDTLAGLVVMLAGRVPARGEILQHGSGLEFEIVEADPRRIHRVRIRTRASSKQAMPRPQAAA